MYRYSCLLTSVSGCSMLIRTSHKLFRGIFWDRKDFILNWAFLLRNCQIPPVFQSSFTKNSFTFRSGSWFEIIYPDPDPARSFGSDRIRIHNTAYRTLAFSFKWFAMRIKGLEESGQNLLVWHRVCCLFIAVYICLFKQQQPGFSLFVFIVDP